MLLSFFVRCLRHLNNSQTSSHRHDDCIHHPSAMEITAAQQGEQHWQDKQFTMGRGALVFKGDSPKKKSKKKFLPLFDPKKYKRNNNNQFLPWNKPRKNYDIRNSRDWTRHFLWQGIFKSGRCTYHYARRRTRNENRHMTMRLSNNSCAVSSSFSENAKLPTNFFIIEKPCNKELERLQQRNGTKISHAVQQARLERLLVPRLLQFHKWLIQATQPMLEISVCKSPWAGRNPTKWHEPCWSRFSCVIKAFDKSSRLSPRSWCRGSSSEC